MRLRSIGFGLGQLPVDGFLQLREVDALGNVVSGIARAQWFEGLHVGDAKCLSLQWNQLAERGGEITHGGDMRRQGDGPGHGLAASTWFNELVDRGEDGLTMARHGLQLA